MGRLYGFAQWGDLIPEQPPVLMVDCLEIESDGNSAVGVKAISMDEAFFQGHFPNGPIMPGVLQVAAMAQVGGALLRSRLGSGLRPWMKALRRVKFRRPVTPGDRLRIEVRVVANSDSVWTLEAATVVGTETACSGTILLEMRPASEPLPPPATQPAELPAQASAVPVADANGIQSMIPHRYPFLFVDRIAVMEEERVVGIKNVTGGEPWFRGSPLPLFPAAMLVEAAAQAACARALTAPQNHGKIGYFMSIDEADFHRCVQPGEQLVMDVNVQQRGRFGMAQAVLTVGAEPVCEAAMKFAIVDRPQA